jgi:AcrR family transcriptional regulator
MSRNTKQRLIDTAFELFGRGGFHAVGLDQILDAVGVSKQTFYNHFECKDELILAVLSHRHETEMKVFDDLLKQLAGTDARKRLYAIFDALEAWFNLPEWRGCIFLTAAGEFPTASDPAHKAALAHVENTRENLTYMAALAGAQQPALLADQLLLLLQGVTAFMHVTADPRGFEIVRQMGKMLLDNHLPAETAAKPARRQTTAVQ